jgi:hypothetical protein
MTEDEHKEWLSGSGTWLRRAHGHLYLANILYDVYWTRARERPRPHSLAETTEEVALVTGTAYHWGMALELAVKGAIAKRRGEIPPFKHLRTDLKWIVEALGGRRLTADERSLAERLGEAVWWWGRYSVPTKREDYEVGQRSLEPQDRQILEGLLNELGVAESIQ